MIDRIIQHVCDWYGIDSDSVLSRRVYPQSEARACIVVLVVMFEIKNGRAELARRMGVRRGTITNRYHSRIDELRMCPNSDFSVTFWTIFDELSMW